jgi:hypothetical protein
MITLVGNLDRRVHGVRRHHQVWQKYFRAVEHFSNFFQRRSKALLNSVKRIDTIVQRLLGRLRGCFLIKTGYCLLQCVQRIACHVTFSFINNKTFGIS